MIVCRNYTKDKSLEYRSRFRKFYIISFDFMRTVGGADPESLRPAYVVRREGNVFSLSTRREGVPQSGARMGVHLSLSSTRTRTVGSPTPIPPPGQDQDRGFPHPIPPSGQDQDRGTPTPLARTRTGTTPTQGRTRTGGTLPPSPALPLQPGPGQGVPPPLPLSRTRTGGTAHPQPGPEQMIPSLPIPAPSSHYQDRWYPLSPAPQMTRTRAGVPPPPPDQDQDRGYPHPLARTRTWGTLPLPHSN